jgi:ubiquinone/menaquinone biosynthesis C-methylase UbiE
MDPDTSERAKSQIAGVFDRASTTYGQAGPAYFAYFGRRLVKYANLLPGMRVLDVACGRGAVLFAAAEAVGPVGSVTGIDLSAGMVDATQADILQRGVTQATAQVMDAEHLQFPDATFDALTCGFGLFFLPSLDTALTEFQRVLRPGGLLAVSTWGSRDRRWSWYDDLVKRLRPGAPKLHAPFVAAEVNTPEKVTARLQQAGFSMVSVESETATFSFSSPEQWWNELWSLYFREPLERLSPEELASVKAEAMAHARDMFARNDLITERNVLYTVGIRPSSA